MMKKCRTCRFWLPTGYGKGDCRCEPPQVVVDTRGSGSPYVTVWPTTDAEDGCGRHAK